MTHSTDLPMVYIVAPTYRESAAVTRFCRSFEQVYYPRYHLVIVNSNPGDETSRLLRTTLLADRITEVRGAPSLFWSATVNLGMRWVQERAAENDFVVIMNVDVTFTEDVITQLVGLAGRKERTLVGALSCAQGRVVSSGVRVRSWMLAYNEHPLAGWAVVDVPAGFAQPVHFLTTRCLLVPVRALREAGLANEKRLPHYAADYEFTCRLRRAGYQPWLYGDVRVESDVSNTGYDPFAAKMPLPDRIRRLTATRSQYNPRDRFWFVVLAYPWYSVPTALVSYFLKTLMEVLLGGARLRRIFSGVNRSFS